MNIHCLLSSSVPELETALSRSSNNKPVQEEVLFKWALTRVSQLTIFSITRRVIDIIITIGDNSNSSRCMLREEGI
jgi:hypothetical protein